MTTAAIYGRISTGQQRSENQLPALRAYAADNGWPVLDYLEEAPAKNRGRRPVLAQLLEDAKAGKFNVVLCWKMAPFGRSVQDFVHNLEVLDKAGVRFVCVSQPILDTDQRSPASKMLMLLLANLVEFERDLMGERVQLGVARALKEQARAARYCPQFSRGSRSGKNLSHGAPRKIWHRDRAAELQAQGMSIRQIAEELGSTYGSVRRALKATCDWDTYISSGAGKQAKGDLDGALADSTKAIQAKPDSAQAYRSRSLAKRAKNNFVSACEDLAKAKQLEAAEK